MIIGYLKLPGGLGFNSHFWSHNWSQIRSLYISDQQNGD